MKFITSMICFVLDFMENPDVVKGDTPTLREQMEVQNRAERNKPKQCYACGSRLPA